MPEVLFNDIYALFKSQHPAEAIRQFRLMLAAKNTSGPAFQLVPVTDACNKNETDPVLSEMGLCIESYPVPARQTVHTPYLPAAIAARLGLLARILSVSWQHLSARTSFGVKTTRHQLIKAEFADISNHIDFLLAQWKQRLAQHDYSDAGEDHWEISVLTNRAEKLMGGHGYLLGNSHSLSWLSVMIYSLYGKSGDEQNLPAEESRIHAA